MKPRRWLAALAVAGFLCMGGVAATAAPAGAAAGARVSASSAVEPLHANAVPQVSNTCAFRGTHFTTYYDGCVHWTRYACVALHQFNISPPSFVSNSCFQAVDLFSGSGETGTIICIPAHHMSGALASGRWHSFRITGGGACLALSRSSAGNVRSTGVTGHGRLVSGAGSQAASEGDREGVQEGFHLMARRALPWSAWFRDLVTR